MAKKNRQEGRDRAKQPAPQVSPAPPPAQPLDPKYFTWIWYGKIFLGCFVVTGIVYLAFVGLMKSISNQYTEDGIAMYMMAKELQKVKRDADGITGELSALDAIVDLEKLKLFLLNDIAEPDRVTEDTKARLRAQDQQYADLVEHLKEVKAIGGIQAKIRDRTVGKINEIRECIRLVFEDIDSQDRKIFRRKVLTLTRKIDGLSWYTQIAAGFFSWPAAYDAAERCFFEALRFWTKNPEASYWWGKTLEEAAITDVAAEKKIMAIKFDPDSELADSVLAEIKSSHDANPDHPRSIYNYAFALYRKGRVDEALPLYRKVYARDPQMNTFEGFLAKRRIDIIERKIDMRWYKTDDF